MKFAARLAAFLAGLLAASACAQSAPRLNLRLPPDNSDESASAAPSPRGNEASDGSPSTAADASTPAASSTPGVPYSDPGTLPRNPEAAVLPKCDDATYGQAEVHGSTTVGVVAGKRVSGNYQSGAVNVSKAFGSCDHPTGGVSITVDVGRGNFSGRRHGWR